MLAKSIEMILPSFPQRSVYAIAFLRIFPFIFLYSWLHGSGFLVWLTIYFVKEKKTTFPLLSDQWMVAGIKIKTDMSNVSFESDVCINFPRAKNLGKILGSVLFRVNTWME